MEETLKTLSGGLSCERDTQQLASQLGAAIEAGSAGLLLLALEGELGAGKSFFARALLVSQGVTGPVRSPTYTLIEPYDCNLGMVLHLDLYRLADPEEMLYLGLEDQLASAKLAMIEWPDQGLGYLPGFDLRLNMRVTDHDRQWCLTAYSEEGLRILSALDEMLQAAV